MTVNPYVGKWIMESSENLDEFMKEMSERHNINKYNQQKIIKKELFLLISLEINFLFRKAAGVVKPTFEITIDGDQWTWKTISSFINMSSTFKIGEEFEESKII
jgi:hypothetical protein